jgi:hypothetical protein
MVKDYHELKKETNENSSFKSRKNSDPVRGTICKHFNNEFGIEPVKV